ncbi:peptide/nickel transport system ATP-binding protein [Sinosporangium album]|uniref:Peptide/nickel transport system ATP-binding protein n=1 Tax=Sinosporangium album TaxID=504805 RepID=A0A1G7SAI8_9ACTN|nr:ATP-binding cassette domain-containing protein [Sinosporangium album]SDG20065.1 peptide/nickel transport system ATP-binding protein [Sinosporangium album]
MAVPRSEEDPRERGSAAAPPLIRVRDLRVAFRRAEVVRGISFTVSRGECVAIVGESGAGKSVALRSLVGLAGAGASVRASRLQIGGHDARAFRTRDFRRLRERLTGLVTADAPMAYGRPRAIGDEIATALDTHPELIVLDDPLSTLDPVARTRHLRLLAERRDAGTAVLVTGHDLAALASVADRVLVMHDGVIVEEGPAQTVTADPRHPRTRRLLAATASGASRGTRLAAVTRDGVALRPALPPRRIDIRSVVVDAVHLTARGRAGEIVTDVSFRIHRGETLGVIGESGAGKSTLGRLLAARTRPAAGEVYLHGRPWSWLPERSRRPWRSMIQLIPQEPLESVGPRHTVERLIGESLSALPGYARRARVADLLDRVGLPASVAGLRPRALSRGERQRVAVARALAPRPDLIVCDDPVAALPTSGKAEILDLLAETQAADGTALMFISHDLGVVHHVSDRVLVMDGGRVVEEGDVDDVFFLPRHRRTEALLAAAPPVLSPR